MDCLQNEKDLMIIPDRELYALPYAALLDLDGTYMIEKYSISVMSSIGSLLELQRRHSTVASAKKSALVVGDPHYRLMAPNQKACPGPSKW
jgi:CHAT domain-containing protein